MNNKFNKTFRIVISKMKFLTNDIEKKYQNSMKKQQIQQSDNFLNAGMYELAFNMSQNGYDFSINQQKKIDTHIISVVNQKSELWVNLLNKYVNQGLTLDTKHILHMIKNEKTDFRREFLSSEVFSNPNDSFYVRGYEHFFSEFKRVIFSDSFSKEIMKEFKECLNSANTDQEDISYDKDRNRIHYANIDRIHNLAYYMDTMPEILLKNTPFKEFTKIMTEYKKIENRIDISLKFHNRENLNTTISESFKNVLNTFYANDVVHALHKTKEVYPDSYLNNQTIKANTNFAKNTSLKLLPLIANEQINKIKFQYANLSQFDNLNTKNLFDIKNIFEKRIPEVLQKFLSMSPEYRTSLKDLNGKTAKDLMIESLKNFSDVFEDILKNANKEKLQNLSVMSNYSQKIKH